MSESSSVFTAPPHRSSYYLSSTSCQTSSSINVMHLNHPEITPAPQSPETLSPMKLVPGAKKGGDLCSKGCGAIHRLLWVGSIIFLVSATPKFLSHVLSVLILTESRHWKRWTGSIREGDDGVGVRGRHGNDICDEAPTMFQCLVNCSLPGGVNWLDQDPTATL